MTTKRTTDDQPINDAPSAESPTPKSPATPEPNPAPPADVTLEVQDGTFGTSSKGPGEP